MEVFENKPVAREMRAYALGEGSLDK